MTPRDAAPRDRDAGAPRGPTAEEVELPALVSALAGRRVLVLADLIVDEFVITGEPRVSREAPVLILKYEGQHLIPGGGANAAANVAALGGIPMVVGEVGDDAPGMGLIEELRVNGADVSAILVRPGARTPRKTRFLAGGSHVALQQVVRVDRIEPFDHDDHFEDEVRERAASLVAAADAVLVSDYGLGFAEPRLVRAVLASGLPTRARIAVDSRYRLLEHGGAHVATPSEPELEAMLGGLPPGDEGLERAGRQVLARLGLEALVLTLGSEGMRVFEKDRATMAIPAFGSGTVADVTGAGDTVIATLSLALAAGASYASAARLANAAAGVAVTKMGTATVSAEELSSALERDPA